MVISKNEIIFHNRRGSWPLSENKLSSNEPSEASQGVFGLRDLELSIYDVKLQKYFNHDIQRRLDDKIISNDTEDEIQHVGVYSSEHHSDYGKCKNQIK